MPPMPPTRKKLPDYKSVDDAAAEIGVSVRTLWRWIEDEQISTVPNATYVSQDDIERLKLKHKSDRN
jgi:hypothetical protein